MKFHLMVLVLLMTIFQLNNTIASENIAGTWQGELGISPDVEVTVQFIIEQAPDGSYSVVLNSLDAGGKNINATSVVYSSGRLKLDVDELNGSYEGVVKDRKIDGQWKQEGTFFPLSLSPYEKLPLFKEDMAKLSGKWHGKPVLPVGGLGGIAEYVFRFEMTEKDEFVGFAAIVFWEGMPRGQDVQITDMGMSDGSLMFEVPSFQWIYKGKLSDNEIVGELKVMGVSKMALSLKKGEYIAKTANSLSLPEERMELLLGKWSGKLVYNKELEPFTTIFRFGKTENGGFFAFIDIPEQFTEGIPVMEANLRDGELILKTEDFSTQFEILLSGEQLVGEWTQGGVSYALSLTKEGL